MGPGTSGIPPTPIKTVELALGAPPTFIPLSQLLSNLRVVGAAHHTDLHPTSQLLQEGSHLGVNFLQGGGGGESTRFLAVSASGTSRNPHSVFRIQGAHVPSESEVVQGLEPRPQNEM